MGITGLLKIYSPGAAIIAENEISRKMFVIKEGKARVYRTYLDQKITLAILGPGEIFGEMSFFDAEPRSASVEALSEIKAVEIDGENVQTNLENIPSWFFPLLKTVFHRFREADKRVTILQSMYEFKKKTLKGDDIAKVCYLETQRLLKILNVLYEKHSRAGSEVPKTMIYSELDSLSGQRTLGLSVFWDALKNFDYIDAIKDEAGVFHPDQKRLERLSEYLKAQVKEQSFMILTHSALAIIKRILSKVSQNEKDQTTGSVMIKDLGLSHVPLHADALKELEEKKVLQITQGALSSPIPPLMEVFMFQGFLKCFDHMHVNID